MLGNIGEILLAPPPLAPDVHLRFHTASYLDSRVTLTRASNGTYYDSSGTLQTAGTNVARFDHDPSDNSPRGILLEGASTNLLLRSAEFDNASWTKARSQIAADAVSAPDGNTTADRVYGTAAAEAFANVNQTVTVTNTETYTFSAYVKKWQNDEMLFLMADGTTTWDRKVNLNTGTLSAGFNTAPSSSSIEDVGDGWYRVQITATVGSTTLTPSPYIIPDGGDWTTNSDENDGFYIWGAQVENKAAATSYIATTSATASRAADNTAITDLSWFNADAGTLVVEYEYGAASHNSARIAVFEEDTTNYTRIVKNGATVVLEQVTDGGVSQFQSSNQTVAANTVHKTALAYEANNFAGVTDGGTVSTDTSGSLPDGIDQLSLGYDSDVAGREINGWIRSVEYYNRRLPDATVQRLTN